MAFFSSRTSLVVSNDFFWKVSMCCEHSRYADVSTNSFRLLPSVAKYDYFCWYLYTVEIENRCPRCFLLCTIIFVIALFNLFYRDCTIGHGVYPSSSIGRIRLGNRWRTYFSVLTFSHSTGPSYQAVTWPRLLCPDRPEMTSNIEGATVFWVMWYTINGKYQCFLGVTFMFLPRVMHFNFLMMLPWWMQNFVPIAQNP